MKLRPLTIKPVLLALTVALAACGSSDDSDPGDMDPTDQNTISGTAAAGAPIIGQVTVKGALGMTKSALIEANGEYTVDVSGLTAPYRLRASGSVGGRTYKLHSYAEEADLGGNVNITPFTDLIVANTAQQIAEAYFETATPTALDSAELDAQEASLQAKLQDVFNALGVDTAIDLLNSTFSADHSGLDAALDIINVEVDSTTNIATITNLIEDTSIEDSFAVTEDPSETLTVTDPDSLTTAVSDTVAIASIFDDLTAAFAAGLPTSVSIEDYFSVDFYESDSPLELFLTDITTDPSLIGLTFEGISVSDIDSTAGTATVNFNVSFNGITDIETTSVPWFAAKDETLGWQLLGDQRIVETDFSFHCNDSDGDGGGDGACGINTRFYDDDFSNNGTFDDAPIASGTMSVIDPTDGTIKALVYLGTPAEAAPGDVQVYNETSGSFDGDWRSFSATASSIFEVGDTIEFKLYTEQLDTSTSSAPQIETGAIAVDVYTETLLQAPSTIAKYPSATAATKTAISDFTLGTNLELAWTLAAGTINSEVLVEITDTTGNRMEIWTETLGNTSSTLTVSSSQLSISEASDAGLDTSGDYNLKVRIYAEDELTGQAHSRDYDSTISGTGGTSTGLSFNLANIPGTYDTLWSDDPEHHEFIFNANSTGTVDFGFGLESFSWSIDSEGSLLVDLGSGALPDRYTLTSGTIKSGTLSAEVDDDSNGVYEAFPTIAIIETSAVGSALTCGYESGWDDLADGGLGAPITANSFADFETVVADCGGGLTFTAADVMNTSFTNDGETTSFFNTGSGTELDPGTGEFEETGEPTIAFEWYVENTTANDYLVIYTDSSIAPGLPSGLSVRETAALTSITGTPGMTGAQYNYYKYSEGSNYGDMIRDSGADGEIWFSADVLQ